MKTIKVKVYKFEELAQNIQNKLIEQERNQLLEDYCEWQLEQDMTAKAKELLKKYFKDKANFVKVYFELTYSQGSGAMIEFDISYYNNHCEVRQDGRYYHENSFEVDYDSYENMNESREKILKNKIQNMNRELSRYGYVLIDEDNWNESLAIESIKDKDSLYYSDGSVFVGL